MWIQLLDDDRISWYCDILLIDLGICGFHFDIKKSKNVKMCMVKNDTGHIINQFMYKVDILA